MKNLKIDWEIVQVNDKIDTNTFECWLNGYDEQGNKYIANALQVCGEIENITDIEKLEPYRVVSSKFIVENNGLYTYQITFNKSLEHTNRFNDISYGLNNSKTNF